MTLTEEAPAPERQNENVGRIESIQGVVIDAVFPDKLPEINHAIKVRRPEAERSRRASTPPPRTSSWSARSSSISATTACGPWRWTPPTASPVGPR